MNFVIEPKLGCGIRILTPKIIRLEGYCRCAPLKLVGGPNTVGYPGLIAEATCYGWLLPMGADYVSSIQHFNVESGG